MGGFYIGGVNYLILRYHSHSDFWRDADAEGRHADKLWLRQHFSG